MGALFRHFVSTRGSFALPLFAAREVATNDIINAAGNGGLLALDTTPVLQRINGSTDKGVTLTWAASNSDEICWNVVAPADLNVSFPVNLIFTAKMGGATNTPACAVMFFSGSGDTNAGGNTAALSSSYAEKTVTIAATDVGSPGDTWAITFTPGAHTTDTVVLLSARVEYTRM